MRSYNSQKLNINTKIWIDYKDANKNLLLEKEEKTYKQI